MNGWYEVRHDPSDNLIFASPDFEKARAACLKAYDESPDEFFFIVVIADDCDCPVCRSRERECYDV